MCSLHFEPVMYGKKALKKSAIPTLLLPSKDKMSIHTQTEIKDLSLYTHTQTPLKLFDTPFKRKKDEQSVESRKKSKLAADDCDDDITEELFLKGCTMFLPPQLKAIVQAQLHLKSHCENNVYTSEFMIFCLNMYCTSPLAYRFLSKTVSLPLKSTLSDAWQMLPMETKITQQMWNILAATAKNMSTSEKECVLCMDKMTLKGNLAYDAKEDKIMGLCEIDGQQQPVVATYAFTLVLRGILSDWKQPIGFSFTSSSMHMEDSLKEFIINTVKHLFNLGFNIRAFLSDMSSEYLGFSEILGVNKENPVFKINGHNIYYIFNLPNLMNYVRNSLMEFDFEFYGKTVCWVDIVNMYEHDKKTDLRSVPGLTDSHIYPNRMQKKKVNYAMQIFSDFVVRSLIHYESLGVKLEGNGSIPFFKLMKDLLDIYNPLMHDFNPAKLLDEAQNVFNNLKVKNRSNGRDVSNNVKFINAFNVTINSLRQLFIDMMPDGYDDKVSKRLNIDFSEQIFSLKRLTSGGGRLPTTLQFAQAFRRTFLCHILNLSDATNKSEDFEKILTMYTGFAENRSQVTMQNFGQTSNHQNGYLPTLEYEFPKENVFHYICSNLWKRCVENNRFLFHPNEEIKKKADSSVEGHEDGEKNLQAPPDDFTNFIQSTEIELTSIFSTFIGNNIGFKLVQHLSRIEFTTCPYPNSPIDFLLKHFIKMRIDVIIACNNSHLKNIHSRNDNCLIVNELCM